MGQGLVVQVVLVAVILLGTAVVGLYLLLGPVQKVWVDATFSSVETKFGFLLGELRP